MTEGQWLHRRTVQETNMVEHRIMVPFGEWTCDQRSRFYTVEEPVYDRAGRWCFYWNPDAKWLFARGRPRQKLHSQ